MAEGASRPSGPAAAVIGVILSGWALSIIAELSGVAPLLHHHALYHSGLPIAVGALLTMAAWQPMTAAMMLPSSLRWTLHVVSGSAGRSRPGRAGTLFLVGYFAVWTGFAGIAFLLDMLLHRVVHGSPWLLIHPQVIAAGTLCLAAIHQLSPLKRSCLHSCRHPEAPLMHGDGATAKAALRLGVGHGVAYLGSCWALMLVMFAVGVAHLAWMALLGAAMVVENVAPAGERAVLPLAIALGGLAIVAGLLPGSVPGL